jgi:exodeoxyribonuclease VII small subunit
MPSSKSKQEAQKQPTFEEMYTQLEEKVSLLEKGGLSLDDSLAAYEDAVGLAQRCHEMLDGAELRITRLRESIAGKDGSFIAEEAEEYDATMDGDDEDEEEDS